MLSASKWNPIELLRECWIRNLKSHEFLRFCTSGRYWFLKSGEITTKPAKQKHSSENPIDLLCVWMLEKRSEIARAFGSLQDTFVKSVAIWGQASTKQKQGLIAARGGGAVEAQNTREKKDSKKTFSVYVCMSILFASWGHDKRFVCGCFQHPNETLSNCCVNAGYETWSHTSFCGSVPLDGTDFWNRVKSQPSQQNKSIRVKILSICCVCECWKRDQKLHGHLGPCRTHLWNRLQSEAKPAHNKSKDW